MSRNEFFEEELDELEEERNEKNDEEE